MGGRPPYMRIVKDYCFMGEPRDGSPFNLRIRKSTARMLLTVMDSLVVGWVDENGEAVALTDLEQQYVDEILSELIKGNTVN